MEFRQLEAFAAVAELKNFSKAANSLFLSQSTVSSHIKNLEKELGKTLIQRTTQSVSLTAEGETFLGYARRMVETRDAALNALTQNTEIVLQLGASSIPSAYLLPRLLTDFQALHPNVRYDIKQGDSDEIQELLLDGTIELGFTGKDAATSRFVNIPFCPDKLVLATPATAPYQQLRERKPSLQELLSCPMIIREAGSGTQSAANAILDDLNLPRHELNIVTHSNDLESIKLMIVDGMGVSICSEFAVRDLAAQGKLLVYPIDTPVERWFNMNYLRTRKLKPALQELVEFTRNRWLNC